MNTIEQVTDTIYEMAHKQGETLTRNAAKEIAEALFAPPVHDCIRTRLTYDASQGNLFDQEGREWINE